MSASSGFGCCISHTGCSCFEIKVPHILYRTHASSFLWLCLHWFVPRLYLCISLCGLCTCYNMLACADISCNNQWRCVYLMCLCVFVCWDSCWAWVEPFFACSCSSYLIAWQFGCDWYHSRFNLARQGWFNREPSVISFTYQNCKVRNWSCALCFHWGTHTQTEQENNQVTFSKMPLLGLCFLFCRTEWMVYIFLRGLV